MNLEVSKCLMIWINRVKKLYIIGNKCTLTTLHVRS